MASASLTCRVSASPLPPLDSYVLWALGFRCPPNSQILHSSHVWNLEWRWSWWDVGWIQKRAPLRSWMKENWKMRGDLDRFARGPPAGGREVTGRYLLYIQHRNSVPWTFWEDSSNAIDSNAIVMLLLVAVDNHTWCNFNWRVIIIAK